MRETNSRLSKINTLRNNPSVVLLRLYSSFTHYVLHAKGEHVSVARPITTIILVHLIVLRIVLLHLCLQDE